MSHDVHHEQEVETAAKRQQTLPLSREEKFAYLRGAVLPLESAAARRNVQLLIERIHAHFVESRDNYRVEDLAELMGWSKGTVRGVLRAAKSIGVLSVEEVIKRGSGQAANRYRIDWHAIRGYNPGREPEKPPSNFCTPGNKICTPGFKNYSAPSKICSANKEYSFGIPREVITSTQDITSKERESSPSWQVVVEEMRATGLVDVHRPVHEARKAGVTPAEVLALIRHFRGKPGAWGLGALHFRVGHAVPGESPSDGWPPESEIYRGQARAVAAEARREQIHSEHQRALAQKAREEQHIAELEAAHGAALDALSAAELDELAGSTDPVLLSTLRQHGRDSPLVRDWLLETLAKTPVPNP